MKRLLQISLPLILAASSGLAMDADAVLKKVLEGPSGPYAGEVTITHWSGRDSHTEEARVYVADPSRYRYEFLSPSGEVTRVVVSSGRVEYVLIPETGKILHGHSARGTGLPFDQTMALLSANYRMSVPEEDEVAGRTVYEVELVPTVDGKPRERIWVDPQTGVVLALRRFGPASSDAAALRFVRFEPDAEFDSDFFDVEKSTSCFVKDHGLRVADKSLDEMTKNGDVYPSSLPFGFIFTGGGHFQLQGETVTQLTYSDGLTVVSVFKTARPVRAGNPSDRVETSPATGLTTLTSSLPTRVVQGTRGKAFFTVMGDGNESLLNNLWREWPTK